MFDPRATASKLGLAERRRLVEIAQAEKALPWIEVDDVLQALGLVSHYSDELNNPVASIGAKGWQVLSALARR